MGARAHANGNRRSLHLQMALRAAESDRERQAAEDRERERVSNTVSELSAQIV